jgi:predicted membrane channel-forming protein YqfA (hemolysin III family)
VLLKKLIEYKHNILYCFGLLIILAINVLIYSGRKDGYFDIFLFAIILAPMLVIMKPKNKLKVDFAFAVLIAIIIVLYAIGLWEYKDRLPSHVNDISQIPEEVRGQFGFENPLRFKLLFTCSSISILISLLIRVISSKFKIVKA